MDQKQGNAKALHFSFPQNSRKESSCHYYNLVIFYKRRRKGLLKDTVLRPVVWMGASKKQLKKMPEDVQKQLGGELYLAQRGLTPPHGKSFKGIGSGVFEIKDDCDSNTYRLVYAVQIGVRLYVLHAFQKKSKKGIATPKKDVDLIVQRYKEAVEQEKEYAS